MRKVAGLLMRGKELKEYFPSETAELHPVLNSQEKLVLAISDCSMRIQVLEDACLYKNGKSTCVSDY